MLETFNNICVIVPGARGVIIMSTVALRGLRRKYPESNIAALCWHPELLEGLDYYIDEVSFPIGNDVFPRYIFDRYIIDLTQNVNYLPHRRKPRLHVIDILCCIAGVNNDGIGPDLWIPKIECERTRQFLQEHNSANRKCLVIHPQSSTPNKDWPRPHWNNLVEALRGDCVLFQVGGNEPVHSSVVSVPTDGKMQFALLALSDLLVCVDSLFLHAAAAVGINNCIVLCGSSHPQTVCYKGFKALYKQSVDCQPCGRPYSRFDVDFDENGRLRMDEKGDRLPWICKHRTCLQALTVDEVMEEIECVLKKKL